MTYDLVSSEAHGSTELLHILATRLIVTSVVVVLYLAPRSFVCLFSKCIYKNCFAKSKEMAVS